VFQTVAPGKGKDILVLHGDLQMKCRLLSFSASKIGTGIVLTIGLDNIYSTQVEQLVNKFNCKKEYEIREAPKKRSLNSNSYAWLLLDKLAEKLKTTPEEVYKIAVSRVGVFEEIKVNSAEAGKRFKRIWHQNGLGWLTKTIDDTTVLAYYGSSTYDTQQMTRLIDYIQEECKEQGIEVRPQWEVDAMLKEWG
jgi:hypothetical protein